MASEMDIKYLPGVGPKRAELLQKELGASTVGELLRVYPFRYIDKSGFVLIADARPDMAYIQLRASVLRVELFANEGTSRQVVKRMSVWIGDGSGEMEVIFFKGIKWMHERLKPGTEWIFFGKPQTFNGRINMVHPEVDPVPAANVQSDSSGVMTGVYNSTEKLKNAGVTGKVMNKIMEAAIEKGISFEQETLPEYLLKERGLVPLQYALRNIHFPKDAIALEKSRYRLKFEELFFLQLSLLKQKYVRCRETHGIHMPRVGEAFNRCYEALPFPSQEPRKG
jgi:ATP-dependent DNA helicase RecG